MVREFIKAIITPTLLHYYQICVYELLKNNMFEKYYGYRLNIKNPETFSEKIFFRKYFGNNEVMANYADKYKVRDFVRDKIGEEYLIPLYGVYDKLTIDDLEKLPEKFVVKTNHGSGDLHIEIVKCKSSHDLKMLVHKMNHALTLNYGYAAHERYYSFIERKIIIEKYMEGSNGELSDYKFHCFKGTGHFVAVDEGRFVEHLRSVYDENWNLTDIKLNDFKPIGYRDKPKNFELMQELALKLASDFDYVRVDLYNVNGNIYFGEITQTPANGLERITPIKYAKIWGEMWKMDVNNKELYDQKAIGKK